MESQLEIINLEFWCLSSLKCINKRNQKIWQQFKNYYLNKLVLDVVLVKNNFYKYYWKHIFQKKRKKERKYYWPSDLFWRPPPGDWIYLLLHLFDWQHFHMWPHILENSSQNIEQKTLFKVVFKQYVKFLILIYKTVTSLFGHVYTCG